MPNRIFLYIITFIDCGRDLLYEFTDIWIWIERWLDLSWKQWHVALKKQSTHGRVLNRLIISSVAKSIYNSRDVMSWPLKTARTHTARPVRIICIGTRVTYGASYPNIYHQRITKRNLVNPIDRSHKCTSAYSLWRPRDVAFSPCPLISLCVCPAARVTMTGHCGTTANRSRKTQRRRSREGVGGRPVNRCTRRRDGVAREHGLNTPQQHPAVVLLQ